MAADRDATIDVAKGIAIIMIVVGHVLRGLSSSGLVDSSAPWYPVTDAALYQVHLAAFIFLAGLFVPHGVDRRGVWPYLKARLFGLTYVYVVWTLGQGLLKVLTASVINSPLTPLGIIKSFWEPDGQLWFLPFFALLTTIMVVIRPWRDSRLAVCAAVASVLVAGAAWGDPWGSLFFTRGWALTPFFVAGVLLGYRRFSSLLEQVGRGCLLALLMSLTFAAIQFGGPSAPTSAPNGVNVRSAMLGAAGAVVGMAALVGWARVLAPTRMGRPLAACGRASMEIFLAHIAVAAGIRVVSLKLHLTDPILLVGICTACGVGVPVVLARLATHWRVLGWLFTPPVMNFPARTEDA